MANKNSVGDWDVTPINNDNVGGVDISEGCAPSGINNALRALMGQVKTFHTGVLEMETELATELGGKATPADIQAAINALLGAAPAQLDTIVELAAALGNDGNYAATTTAALAARLRKDQNLADLPDKAAARVNLGVPSTAAATDAANGLMSAADKAKLDAVKSMANRSVTISTQPPSGGVDGDIWFQYV